MMRVNLKDLERRSKDLSIQFKQCMADTLTLALFKEAQRVEYIALAVLKLVQNELQGKPDFQTLLSLALKFLE